MRGTNDSMDIQVGSLLEGKVSSITNFGAFISLEDGKSGLVHISEVSNTFVNDVHDFLQVGQTVKVKVLSAENGKINLSIKRAQPQAAPAPKASPAKTFNAPPKSAPSADQSFEDKLKQFLSSSEGKMADLNRNIAGKQGGRRRK